MRTIPEFHRKVFLLFLSAIFISAWAAGNMIPIRLDLFDAANNPLMYVTFGYDETGRNISRSVFMSDETFIRDVMINYDTQGRRANEVSYNFNGDTSFVLRHTYTETGATFSIVDQFKLDHVGGNVLYSTVDSPNFGLIYESGNQAASMAYIKDADGNLDRVEIAAPNGDTYYGLFTNAPAVGVSQSALTKDLSPQAAIVPRGASQIDVRFNLRSAGEVNCELLTLSGRRAVTLYSGRMKQGRHTRTFRFNSGSLRRIANGVYLFKISVNGVTISRSRYLHQSMTAGGVQ
jgi:hypothetical protein